MTIATCCYLCYFIHKHTNTHMCRTNLHRTSTAYPAGQLSATGSKIKISNKLKQLCPLKSNRFYGYCRAVVLIFWTDCCCFMNDSDGMNISNDQSMTNDENGDDYDDDGGCGGDDDDLDGSLLLDWVWWLCELNMMMCRHWKHRYKTMPMAIWFIVPATFFITDVRDNFVKKFFTDFFFQLINIYSKKTSHMENVCPHTLRIDSDDYLTNRLRRKLDFFPWINIYQSKCYLKRLHNSRIQYSLSFSRFYHLSISRTKTIASFLFQFF